MDPVSAIGAAASVVGLVQMAKSIVSAGFTLAKTIAGAEEEVLSLVSEVTGLYGVLNGLHLVTLQFEGNQGVNLQAQLESCFATLQKIEDMLAKCNSAAPSTSASKSISGMKKRVKWVANATDTKKRIGEVERHKSTLSLAVQRNSMSALMSSLEKQDAISSGLDRLQVDLNEEKTARLIANMDKAHRTVLESFSKINAQKAHERIANLRYPGTGTWLLESDTFNSWMDGSHKTLWMYGNPGVGKTVLMSALIGAASHAANQNVGLAFFYCDYRQPETQIPAKILGSLISQIAVQNRRAFKDIEKFLSEKSPQTHRDAAPESGQARRATDSITDSTTTKEEDLVGLLQQISTYFDKVLIFVDGIDECGEHMGVVAQLLSTFADPDLSNISTLMASRDEQQIRFHLDSVENISIAARSSDIRLYVESELDDRIQRGRLRLRTDTFRHTIKDRLVEKAEGMFQWVTCQLDHLCQLPTDKARKQALETLPPTLKATYERILSRVNASSTITQKMVAKILRWVVYSKHPLQLKALATIISIEGETSIDEDAVPCDEDILQWCSSLLRLDAKRNILEPSHYSVVEFLESISSDSENRFAQYRLDSFSSGLEIAKDCIDFLSLNDFATGYHYNAGDFESRTITYPFFEYAVCFWDAHASHGFQSEGGDSQTALMRDILCSRVCTFFTPTKSQSFLCWSQARVVYQSRRSRRRRPSEIASKSLKRDLRKISEDLNEVTTIHVAAALNLPIIVKKLLASGCDPNRYSTGKFGSVLSAAIFGHDLFNFKDLKSEQGTAVSNEPTFPAQPDNVERHLAAQCVILKSLLDAGADPNTTDDSGRPLLYSILTQADARLSIPFLDAGAIVTFDIADELLYWDKVTVNEFSSHLSEANLKEDVHRVLGLLAEKTERSNMTRLIETTKGIAVASLVTQANLTSKVRNLAHTTTTEEPDREDQVKHVHILQEMARWGQKDALEIHITRVHDVNMVVDETKSTALHKAASNGHLDVVMVLMRYGAHVMALDSQGNTPLHLACENSRNGVVKYFLEHYSNQIASVTEPASDSWSPLMLAARCCSAEVFLTLLERSTKTSIHATGPDGYTLLHFASCSGNPEKIRALLDQGLDVNALADNLTTPLMYAAENMKTPRSYKEGLSDQEKMLRLLQEHGAQADLKDDRGDSVLHLAIKSKEKGYKDQWRIYTRCRLFGVLGDSIFKLTNNEGHQALTVLTNSLISILENYEFMAPYDFTRDEDKCHGLFITRKRNRGRQDSVSSRQSDSGDSDISSDSGSELEHSEYSTAIQELWAQTDDYIETAKYIVNGTGGANSVNHQDNQGRTSLHIIAEKGQGFPASEFVVALLKEGAVKDIRDHQGRTPLDLALDSRLQNIDIISLLLPPASQGNIQDDEGQTILHKLVQKNKNDAIAGLYRKVGADELISKYLKAYTPDLNLANLQGQTALICAIIQNQSSKVFQALLSNICEHCLSQQRFDGLDLLELSLKHRIGEDCTALFLDALTKNYNNKLDNRVLQLAAQNGASSLLFRRIMLKCDDVTKNRSFGVDLLHSAIKRGFFQPVVELISAGVDIESHSKGHCFFGDIRPPSYEQEEVTPLLQAFMNKQYGEQTVGPVIPILIENGANIEAKTSDGWGVLHFALQEGREPELRFLAKTRLDFTSACTVSIDLVDHIDGEVSRVGGVSALHIAAGLGSRDTIEILLRTGAFPNINIQDEKGRTPLHYTVFTRLTSNAALLKSRGADLDIMDNDGITAGLMALVYGEKEIATLLKGERKALDAVESNMTPLTQLSTPAIDEPGKSTIARSVLYRTIVAGNIDFWTHVVLNGFDLEAPACMHQNKDESGCSPYCVAIKHEQSQIASLLLENGAQVPGRCCYSDSSPPSSPFRSWPRYAPRPMKFDEFECFNDLSPPFPISRSPTRNFSSDFLRPSRFAEWSTLRDYLDGKATILPVATEDESEVSKAVFRTLYELRNDFDWYESSSWIKNFTLLCSHGKNLRMKDGPSDDGYTALHHAVSNGLLKAAEVLLDADSSALHATDHLGYTPLHIADAQCAHFLIHRGAEIEARSNLGETVLHRAAHQGDLDLIRLLLEKGAYVNARDHFDCTPLVVTAKMGHHNRFAASEILYSFGADIDVVDHDGTHCLFTESVWESNDNLSPLVWAMVHSKVDWRSWKDPVSGLSLLHSAIMNGSIGIPSFLIENGANILCSSPRYGFPIHIATRHGLESLTGGLLKLIPKDRLAEVLELPSHAYGTVLRAAAYAGYAKIVELLLTANASIEYADYHEGSALNSACANGHVNVVELLLAKGAPLSVTDSKGNIKSAKDFGKKFPKVLGLLVVSGTKEEQEYNERYKSIVLYDHSDNPYTILLRWKEKLKEG